LNFAAAFADLQQLFKKVLIHCQQKLVDHFSRSFPQFETRKKKNDVMNTNLFGISGD